MTQKQVLYAGSYAVLSQNPTAITELSLVLDKAFSLMQSLKSVFSSYPKTHLHVAVKRVPQPANTPFFS